MSSDAIVVLKEDHARIRKLFKEFQQAGDGATKAKAAIVKRVIEELTVHTYLENEVMYPRVRALMPALEEDVLESYEEHHVADVLCFELSGMEADDERFAAKTTVLIESVTHHIDEEEQDRFPKIREGIGRKDLQDIGAAMVELRKTAPRSPVQPSALKKAIDAVIR
jgi:hemerythrin superfamily protein